MLLLPPRSLVQTWRAGVASWDRRTWPAASRGLELAEDFAEVAVVFLRGTALTAGGGLPLGDKSGVARDICYSGLGCCPDRSRIRAFQQGRGRHGWITAVLRAGATCLTAKFGSLNLKLVNEGSGPLFSRA